MREPSNQQLQAALNNACLASAFGIYEVQLAVTALKELRNSRTVWIGDDVELREDIDKYIDWFETESY